MEIKDLQSGMRILKKGTIENPIEYGLVLDDEIFIFHVGNKSFKGSTCKHHNPNILAVWSPNTPKGTNIGIDFLRFMAIDGYWKLLWEKPLPIVEMTLTQVCEALGKNIKIIKED